MESLLYQAAITVMVGLPGHGKSRQLARRIAMSRSLTLHNLELKPKHPRFNDRTCFRIGEDHGLAIRKGQDDKSETTELHGLPDFGPFGGAEIYIDEADLLFDCKEHGKIGAEYMRWLKFHRKKSQRIIFVVQNLKNLWVRIRRMSQTFQLCWHDYKTPSKIWSVAPISLSRWWCSEFASEEQLARWVNAGGKGVKPLREGYEWYRQGAEVFDWYNTKQLDFA